MDMEPKTPPGCGTSEIDDASDDAISPVEKSPTCVDSAIDVGGGNVHRFGRVYREWRRDGTEENTDEYFCPDDEQEYQRQDIAHHAVFRLMGGKLHLAPVLATSPIRYPNWHVVGTDWSSAQPDWHPSNVRFELGNLRITPWAYANGSFDYIHTRSTTYVGCWKDFSEEAIHQAFDCLRPGGWFESQEIGRSVNCDDGSVSVDTSLACWARNLDRAASLKGHPRDVAERVVEWYRDPGFVDVHQRVFKMPIGVWAADPALQKVGLCWGMSLGSGLGSLSSRLFHEALRMDYAKITEFLSRVRQDIKNPLMHAYTRVHVVVGHKPMPDEPFLAGDTPSDSPETTETQRPVSIHENETTPPPEAPELTRAGSTASSSDDDCGDDNSCGEGSSSSASTTNDHPSSLSLFQHQQRIFVDRLIRQLCKYLGARVADAERDEHPRSETSQIPLQESGTYGGSIASVQATTKATKCRAGQQSHDSDNDNGDNDGDDRRRKRPRMRRNLPALITSAAPLELTFTGAMRSLFSVPGAGSHSGLKARIGNICNKILPMNQRMTDGFTKEQEKMLRSRRRASPAMSREDRWNDVYKILFPDDDVNKIPTPYYGVTDTNQARAGIENYAVYLRREMPGHARRELDIIFQDELQSLQDTLRPRIEQTMINLQLRLLRMFRDGEAPSPEPSPEPSPDILDEPGELSLQDSASTPHFAAINEPESTSFDYTQSLQRILWDHDPMVSADSAVTPFPENNFDISFEKLLDQEFTCEDMGCTTSTGLDPK
ncbi:hypothetical protein OQA88_1085 [Cercophora sp. LCS_1]